MGRVSKEYESPFNTKTYDDLKRTYLWIVDILKLFGAQETNIRSHFFYSIGDMNITDESVDAFTENAYGHKINLLYALISYYDENIKDISFHISKDWGKMNGKISISCDSKKRLAIIEDKIGEASDKRDKSNATMIHNHYGDNIVIKDNTTVTDSIIVGGDGGNNITINEKKGFWKRIWQKIIANIIWLIIIVIIVALFPILRQFL
jgi:hypothetical protein